MARSRSATSPPSRLIYRGSQGTPRAEGTQRAGGTMPRSPVRPLELFAIDGLLTDEERTIRATVREFGDRELRPHVAGWFESGEMPAREVARQLGGLGLLGMHLEGYGCAGTNAVSYGLACLELEAVDSGLRSLVSVQGSLSMYAIWKFGSPEQKEQWLPAMAAGER